MRDFASHFIKQILLDRCLSNKPNAHLLNTLENCLLKNLTRITDELVLNTILDTLRNLISYLKQHPTQHDSVLASLSPLVNLKDDNDDFFASFLSIKMKTR